MLQTNNSLSIFHDLFYDFYNYIMSLIVFRQTDHISLSDFCQKNVFNDFEEASLLGKIFETSFSALQNTRMATVGTSCTIDNFIFRLECHPCQCWHIAERRLVILRTINYSLVMQYDLARSCHLTIQIETREQENKGF